MSKEEIETQFLKKYGCTTLFEFVDVCLDFDTSLKVLEDYFEKSYQLDIVNKKIEDYNRMIIKIISECEEMIIGGNNEPLYR